MTITIPNKIKKINELSYSSLLTLHACPRRYQLDKLMNREDVESIRTATFAFGHALGEGVQAILRNEPWESVLFKMFLAWDTDLLDEETRNKKNFATATLAVQKFYDYYEFSDIQEYELAYFNGKPATELSFKIVLPDGYMYRGFIDAVLRHKTTGQLRVLELKSTGFSNLHEAMYKNSSQALGYTIVLDYLSEQTSRASFEVTYLVYKTGRQEFETYNFVKLFSNKVDWIRDILLDCDSITNYGVDNHFPKRGESCYHFFKACPHLDYCGLKDSNLRLDFNKESEDNTEYDFVIDLMEIIASLEGQ